MFEARPIGLTHLNPRRLGRARIGPTWEPILDRNLDKYTQNKKSLLTWTKLFFFLTKAILALPMWPRPARLAYKLGPSLKILKKPGLAQAHKI